MQIMDGNILGLFYDRICECSVWLSSLLKLHRVGPMLISLGIPDYISNAFNDPDRIHFVVATVLLLEGVFWTCVLFYMVMLHKWNLLNLKRFAIKQTQPYPSNEMLTSCLIDVSVGHFLIRPCVLFLSYPFLRKLLNFTTIPSWGTVLWHLLICSQIDDFLFYWLHRLCHTGWLYKNIHKRHHEFKNTVAIAVEWAHPAEEILVNTIPTVLGPIVLRSHVTVFWLYTCAKLYQSIDAHSGFDLPFPLSPWTIKILGIDCAPAHYFHHSVNIGNFGGFTMFWDWICGTNIKYNNMWSLACNDQCGLDHRSQTNIKKK